MVEPITPEQAWRIANSDGALTMQLLEPAEDEPFLAECYRQIIKTAMNTDESDLRWRTSVVIKRPTFGDDHYEAFRVLREKGYRVLVSREGQNRRSDPHDMVVIQFWRGE